MIGAMAMGAWIAPRAAMEKFGKSLTQAAKRAGGLDSDDPLSLARLVDGIDLLFIDGRGFFFKHV
ncbi:MAG: hypothetical protein HY204_04590 [Nitrospirae bacterium]|nr:hypothetical protein [Nitrospirota bacterium]